MTQPNCTVAVCGENERMDATLSPGLFSIFDSGVRQAGLMLYLQVLLAACLHSHINPRTFHPGAIARCVATPFTAR